ncbi:sirohydrochlorin cobaltochelatase [Anaeromassilibacillus senegalensis]|uniref:sirohydrochlorin cobaltochelatase n=1 Tax=Anaeromassilibacillus senegalensis TaxID=1673717 RepID=UPI000ADE920B|nr:sirohydrochlorin cobaltochelatase [Anaeromassilibacillus senegalensis]
MGKKAILAVSFGTTVDETREKTIGAIEEALRTAFPGWEVRRAFTSPTILHKLAARGQPTENVWQALGRLAKDGFSSVLCQPTYVVNGEEYEDLCKMVKQYAARFDHIYCGRPLLTQTEDYHEVAAAIQKAYSLPESTALVLMGHGTVHFANAAYAALDYVFKERGAQNIFVGAVEGYPELDNLRRQVSRFRPERVVLAPLMVVAGDHARNDMAGETDSWKTAFEADGYPVEAVLKGLGEYTDIRAIYVRHAKDAMQET